MVTPYKDTADSHVAYFTFLYTNSAVQFSGQFTSKITHYALFSFLTGHYVHVILIAPFVVRLTELPKAVEGNRRSIYFATER